MVDTQITRREVLRTLGCSAAAWPLTTRITLAEAPWDARLVVIILRGAMDGLDVIRPVGDPEWPLVRPGATDGLPLDGTFALHPALTSLMPLWRSEELAVAHAVSTPYRNKRSHFDGQDMLEAGTGSDVPPSAVRDGWLNRLLQEVPGVGSETAFAIGRDRMKVMAGPAPVADWSPETRLELTTQAELLLSHIYRGDPLFADTAAEAMWLANRLDPTDLRGLRDPGFPDRPVAAFAADRLRDETRIAAFSISGWDMHANQAPAMERMLGRLADTILTLKSRLGPVWGRTTVLAMTEFGRTARWNGSGGTDHGTAGALLMAGGAIRGGRVYGEWPGLDESALYERRDLMPMRDVRAYSAWALRHIVGVDRATLETKVFPGLDLGNDPGFVA